LKEDQQRFLALLGQPPVRLTVEQAAWILNCPPHDIPVLVAARLLRPLGSPSPNGTKFFATEEVMEQARVRAWLAKVTNAVSPHWKEKNARKLANQTRELPREHVSGEQLAVNFSA
jgi:hypothetical protein